jgi:hypothetical protein
MAQMAAILTIAVLLGVSANGQGGKGPGGTGGSSSAGEVHDPANLLNDFPAQTQNQVVVCYTITTVPEANSVQQYVLERKFPPQMSDAEKRTFWAQRAHDERQQGHAVPFDWRICSDFGDEHPLFNGTRLVIAIIDPTGIVHDNFSLLGLNLVATAQSPITTAPVRSYSATGFVAAGTTTPPNVYYLTWNERLKGDTSDEVTVKALFRLPKAWLPKPTDPNPVPTPDQWVTLLDIAYPQVHTRATYNIATGIVWSSLRNPSFSRLQSSTSPPAYKTVATLGSVTIDPALFFNVYLRPYDSETRWHTSDLYKSIAAGAGFSLSSPANDYFFGLSTEIRRGVQLIGGVHVGKVTELAPVLIPPDPTSSTAPATKQRFTGKGFVGLSFDIDFIKGLFGGGGSSTKGS